MPVIPISASSRGFPGGSSTVRASAASIRFSNSGGIAPPVVVRAAEVVEGHGRLYLRAGARTEAAGVLRAATVRRIAVRLGLDRRTPAPEIAHRLAGTGATGTAATNAATTLLGPAPSDDDALLGLATDLARLEAGSVRTRD